MYEQRSVGACMHRGVISCNPDASLPDVAAIMRRRRVSTVVVVEDGSALGLISETDLVNAVFVEPHIAYCRELTARHLMTSPIVSVPPDAPVGEALRLLQAHRIHRLVVTEPTVSGERPVGIFSLSDFGRVVAAGFRADEVAKLER